MGSALDGDHEKIAGFRVAESWIPPSGMFNSAQRNATLHGVRRAGERDAELADHPGVGARAAGAAIPAVEPDLVAARPASRKQDIEAEPAANPAHPGEIG